MIWGYHYFRKHPCIDFSPTSILNITNFQLWFTSSKNSRKLNTAMKNGPFEDVYKPTKNGDMSWDYVCEHQSRYLFKRRFTKNLSTCWGIKPWSTMTSRTFWAESSALLLCGSVVITIGSLEKTRQGGWTGGSCWKDILDSYLEKCLG